MFHNISSNDMAPQVVQETSADFVHSRRVLPQLVDLNQQNSKGTNFIFGFEAMSSPLCTSVAHKESSQIFLLISMILRHTKKCTFLKTTGINYRIITCYNCPDRDSEVHYILTHRMECLSHISYYCFFYYFSCHSVPSSPTLCDTFPIC